MFPVFLDTCVLLKPYLCDTLLSIAECRIYRPLWSKHVLDELDRNLRKRGATAEQTAHRIDQMTRHFPDAQVAGYEHLIDSMENHPKDRHVLAAAVRGGAEVLVTENLKDFPATALERYDIVAVHQDDFLQDQFESTTMPSNEIQPLGNRARLRWNFPDGTRMPAKSAALSTARTRSKSWPCQLTGAPGRRWREMTLVIDRRTSDSASWLHGDSRAGS